MLTGKDNETYQQPFVSVLRNSCSWRFSKNYRKTPVPDPLLIYSSRLIIKMGLQHRCFSVNFSKSLFSLIRLIPSVLNIFKLSYLRKITIHEKWKFLVRRIKKSIHESQTLNSSPVFLRLLNEYNLMQIELFD